MYVKQEVSTKIWAENVKERDNLEDICAVGF
jgi:hypothetical protein